MFVYALLPLINMVFLHEKMNTRVSYFRTGLFIHRIGRFISSKLTAEGCRIARRTSIRLFCHTVFGFPYNPLFPFVPAVLLARVSPFNVDQKNGLSFSGPLEDMFGYTVQQFENSEGKW